MFDQLEDGSHEITLRNIHVPGCEQYPKTHGTLRWTRDKGISFELFFDGIYRISHTPFYVAQTPAGRGVGKFGESDLSTPQWAAETDDGTLVQLFGVNQTPSTFQRKSNEGISTGSSFTGTALYAIVEIPTNRLLSFPESSREDFRMFFSGVTGRCFSAKDDVQFEDHEGGILGTVRCEIELRNHPRVCLISSYGHITCRPSGWLSFEQAPTTADCDISAFSEQTFVSFLNGDKVAFHWADRNIGPQLIRRTYYGWATCPQIERLDGDFRPLPFLNASELPTYGQAILRSLPKLFERFCETDSDMSYGIALHPLWTALHSVLQDRLALVSVSLERTATFWDHCRELEIAKRSATVLQESIWSQKAILRKLRRALEAKTSEWNESLAKIVEDFSTEYEQRFAATEEHRLFVDVMKNNINNLTRIPNSVRLQRPFTDVGLVLSDAEKDAVKARNGALHGHKKDNVSSLTELDRDAETFDHLRMLITKFVLQLCDYDGPFIDYASRPTAGNFVVRWMSEVTGDSSKVSVVNRHNE